MPNLWGEGVVKKASTKVISFLAAGPSGPSPRIRGEFKVEIDNELWAGTIPANTGRMRHRKTTGQQQPDHPREYGENSIAFNSTPLRWGPSPRIRGEFVSTA